MERMTEATNFNNLEENPILQPKSSFPSNVTPAYEDCGPSGSKDEPRLRMGLVHDQPSSPESISMEEHFSWLIDYLLDEPDTPMKICPHRQSSNDLHLPRLHSNPHNFVLEECRQRAIMPGLPLWGSHEFGLFNDGRHYFPNPNWSIRPNYTLWRPELNMRTYSNSLHATKGKDIQPSPSGLRLREHEALESNAIKNPEQEASPEEVKNESEKKDISQVKHTNLQTDSEQFSHTSRVRKLQYITELENCIQALQAEGLEVLAKLQYANEQNYILSFENEVLKQRLNNMVQEQHTKCIQNDMLKREVHRLHQLLQQQRSPQLFIIPRSY